MQREHIEPGETSPKTELAHNQEPVRTQELLQEIEAGLEDGSLSPRLFAGAKSETDLITAYSRYRLAKKLLPDEIDEFRVRISHFNFSTFIPNLRRGKFNHSEISLSEVVNTASELELFDKIGYKLSKKGNTFIKEKLPQRPLNCNPGWMERLDQAKSELDWEKREDAIAAGADFLIANNARFNLDDKAVGFLIGKGLLPSIETREAFDELFPDFVAYQEAASFTRSILLNEEAEKHKRLLECLDSDLQSGKVPPELFHGIKNSRQAIRFLEDRFKATKDSHTPSKMDSKSVVPAYILSEDEKVNRYAKYILAKDMLKDITQLTLLRICTVTLSRTFQQELLAKGGALRKFDDAGKVQDYYIFKAVDVEIRARDLGVLEYIYPYQKEHRDRFVVPDALAPSLTEAHPATDGDKDLEEVA